MADLTKQDIVSTGLNPTFSNAGGGGSGAGTDEILDNDGKTFLYVKNGNAGSIDVTITSEVTSKTIVGYGATTFSDLVVSVPASEERVIGPFPKTRFNDANGEVTVSYDEISSVTVAAIRLPV
jgi:hypothetical protein